MVARLAVTMLVLVLGATGTSEALSADEPTLEAVESEPVVAKVHPTERSQPVIWRWRGSWSRMPRAPIEARSGAATGAVLDWHDEGTRRRSAGGRLFIWSGRAADGSLLSDGAIYDVQAGRWQRLPRSPLSPRTDAVVRYDGDAAFIVWGGYDADGRPLGDGAGYEFRKRRWTMMPPSPLPESPSDFDGNLNGYVAIAQDPSDGSPLVSTLSWDDEFPEAEYNDFGSVLGAKWSWTKPERPPLPTGERYEVVNESGDIATLISYPADGYATAVELEFDTADAGYRDLVRLPITGAGATGHRFERLAWFGSGELPGEIGRVSYGALSPMTRLQQEWRTTSAAPSSVSAEDELIVSPRHVIGPDSLVAWDPTTARWLSIRPPEGGLRSDASAAWLNGVLLLWGGTTADSSVRGDGWIFTPRLSLDTVALPEHGIPSSDGCSSHGVEPRGLRLTGRIGDRRVTWFEGPTTTVRVIWPPGYVARFRPDLEVVDPSGVVVAREGDRLKDRFNGKLNDLALCLFRPAAIRGTQRIRAWTGDDPGAVDWGPLAVIDDPALGGLDAAGGTGRLRIGDRCIFLRADNGYRQTLVWRSGQTDWDSERRQIVFKDRDLGKIRLSHGDLISLGGAATGEGQTISGWLAEVDDACPTPSWTVHQIEVVKR